MYLGHSSLQLFLYSYLDADVFVCLCLSPVFPFSSFSYHLLNLLPSFPLMASCLGAKGRATNISATNWNCWKQRYQSWVRKLNASNSYWKQLNSQHTKDAAMWVHFIQFQYTVVWRCPRGHNGKHCERMTIGRTRWVCVSLADYPWLSTPALGDFRLLRLLPERPERLRLPDKWGGSTISLGNIHPLVKFAGPSELGGFLRFEVGTQLDAKGLPRFSCANASYVHMT